VLPSHRLTERDGLGLRLAGFHPEVFIVIHDNRPQALSGIRSALDHHLQVRLSGVDHSFGIAQQRVLLEAFRPISRFDVY
jgi:hypothetical protein